MKEINYEKVFNILVKETIEYLERNNLKAMVLGISGGIDSTVVAAICHQVSLQTGIPLIGRSLPIKNKEDEFDVSKLVGKAFCNDFAVTPLHSAYYGIVGCIHDNEKQRVFPEAYEASGSDYESRLESSPYMPITKIALGNIQARLRMIYLYNLAGINNGIVISTDNQTEYQLGFFTLHGDVGDFNPLFGLWKTEVYELANWLISLEGPYCRPVSHPGTVWTGEEMLLDLQSNAIKRSIGLTPTDGLGISNSDLEQIGADNYRQVDDVLQEYQSYVMNGYYPENPTGDYWTKEEMIQNFLCDQQMLNIDFSIISKVMNRHLSSEFKRKNLPICIPRERWM